MRSLHVGGLLGVVALLLVGCGGGGGGDHHLSTPGEITGLVLDVNGNIVRDAEVFVNSSNSTFSNSHGEFTLTGVDRPDVLLKAQTNQDGNDYYGEQHVELFSGERTKTSNILVVRTDQLATVRGTVHANSGELLQGVRVFFNSGTRTSTYAITDSTGSFKVSTLAGGLTYNVTATAAGFNSGIDTIVPVAGSTSELDLVMGNTTDPILPAPTGLSAIAWTTPADVTDQASLKAFEQVKRLSDSHRTSRPAQSRVSTLGNPIEVDLTWTPVVDRGLLGYGVYRILGAGPVTANNNIDFDKDPQASMYEDDDTTLTPGNTYSYALTSLNSSFLDGSAHGESGFSTLVSATTLDDLPVDAVTNGPVTFHWHAGSGATSFVVYVFDRFPSIGVSPIWTSAPSGGTSLAYGGPALTSGNTYFFIVEGRANSDTSRTLAPVLEFNAP